MTSPSESLSAPERAAHNSALVLYRLRAKAVAEGSPKVRVSVRKLARSVGIGQRTVFRVVRELEDQNMLRRDRDGWTLIEMENQRMATRDGKLWEQEASKSLQKVPGLVHKSGNSTLPETDMFGTYRGLSWRCECKHVTAESALKFSEVTKRPNEVRVLERCHNEGGLSFLWISHGSTEFRRTWVLTWADFLEMGATKTRGSVPLVPADYRLREIPLVPAGASGNRLPFWGIERFFVDQHNAFVLRQLRAGV